MSDKPEKQMEKLNPRISSIDIGARKLRKVTVYPLTLGGELKLSGVIQQGVQVFMDYGAQPDVSDIAVIKSILELLKQNIAELVRLVTDEGPEILDEITNDQAVDLAELVYLMNFEKAQKKIQSLMQEGGPLSFLRKSWEISVPDIPDTDLSTSSIKPSKKEASQGDK